MTPKIHGKMVYSLRQPMWHAITEPSQVDMKAVEVMNEKFDGGFTVELAQSGYMTFATPEVPSQWVPNEGNFTILRSPTEADPQWFPFGTCTDRYHPLQPMNVAETFDRCVNVSVETMAFLGAGEDMFVSWRLPSFSVRPGDDIEMYGIIRGGFDTEHGWRLFTAGVRPVCWNTISMAQGWADQNSGGNALVGNMWKGKGTNPNLLEHLGYWMEHLQNTATAEAVKLEELFKALAACPVSADEEVLDMLYEAFPNKAINTEHIPHQLVSKAIKDNDAFNEGQRKIRDGIFALFSGTGTAITPDLYGVLNATTEYVCHVMPSKKPIAESVMFGNRASITGRMVNILRERLWATRS